MVDSLDLGDTVLQWREDGFWRAVNSLLLIAEESGEVAADPADWVAAVPGRRVGGSLTCVYGQVADGVPDEVTVGGQPVAIRQLGGVWGASWDAQPGPVVVAWKMAGGRHEIMVPRGRDYVAPE